MERHRQYRRLYLLCGSDVAWGLKPPLEVEVLLGAVALGLVTGLVTTTTVTAP